MWTLSLFAENREAIWEGSSAQEQLKWSSENCKILDRYYVS